MKYLFLYILVVFVSSTVASANTLTCNIEDEPRKIFKCTFKSDAQSEDRNVIFEWSNEDTPQDHRMRTVVFPANHRSVYDYRNYFGRAKGVWQIQVKDENEELITSTTFTLE